MGLPGTLRGAPETTGKPGGRGSGPRVPLLAPESHFHILCNFSLEKLFPLLEKLEITGLGIKLINGDHLIKKSWFHYLKCQTYCRIPEQKDMDISYCLFSNIPAYIDMS